MFATNQKTATTSEPLVSPRISVVIATRNRSHSIANAVSSVLANTYPSFELLVVDQSDDEQTAQALASFVEDSRFRYIYSEIVGVAAARNCAIREAKGGIIAITDDDCTVPTDWLEQIESVFRENPEVAVAFGNVTAPENWDKANGFIPVAKVTEPILQKSLWAAHEMPWMGACMSFQHDIWQKLNGFDEAVGVGSALHSGEDRDFAYRAILQGYSVLNTPKIQAVHYGWRDFNATRTLLFHSSFGQAAVYVKLLKQGNWSVLPVFAHTLFKYSWSPFLNAVRRKKPLGLSLLRGFVKGLTVSWFLPIDRKLSLYKPVRKAAKISKPTFSVVIATRNRGDSCVTTVKSVLANHYPFFEVVVVDQSDEDSTEQALQQFKANENFSYIRSATKGLSRARNVAIERSQADWIAITDDDCEVPADWLEKLAAAITNNPQVGVVFGNTVAADCDWNEYFVPSYVKSSSKLFKQSWALERSGGMGACMATSRKTWAELNGFDAMLGVGAPMLSGEDNDFALRAVAKGYYVLEYPEFSVLHYGLRSKEEMRNTTYRNSFGVGAVLVKLLRSGHFSFLPVFMSETFNRLRIVSWQVLRRKKPYHFVMLKGFADGVLKGLKVPLNRKSGNFFEI